MALSLWFALIGLFVLFVLAVTSAGAVLVSARDRRQFLQRATRGTTGASGQALPGGDGSIFHALRYAVEQVAPRVPTVFRPDRQGKERLRLAGFDAPTAWLWFLLGRTVTLVASTVMALSLAPRADAMIFALVVALGVAIGLFGPSALLERVIAWRQKRIRHAMPDTLDLLVVCLEAGIAMDAAVPRVARELSARHPDFSHELLTMSRQLAAGSPRDQAWHGLHRRTGVEELRGLVTHLMQSERWGTSVATVLRVYAKNLRRRRKSAAEKRAATASTRMLVPLALCIFPTIFVVILGPAMLQIAAAFRGMAQ